MEPIGEIARRVLASVEDADTQDEYFAEARAKIMARRYQCKDGMHVMDRPCGGVTAWPCDCHRVDPSERAYAKMRDTLGGVFTWSTFDGTAEPKAYPLLQRIKADWPMGAYLTGGTGNGKTHAMKALLCEAARTGRQAGFVHGKALADLFSTASSYSDGAEAAKEEIAKLKKLNVLGIDDLGSHTHGQDETFQASFQHFLDTFPANAVLLITSNLTEIDLLHKVGRKCASRIGDRCAKIEFIGPDRRARRASSQLMGGLDSP